MKRSSVKVATQKPVKAAQPKKKKSQTSSAPQRANSGTVPQDNDSLSMSVTNNSCASYGHNTSRAPSGPVVSEEWARQVVRKEDEYLLYRNPSAGGARSSSYNSYSKPTPRTGEKSARRTYETESRLRQAQKLTTDQSSRTSRTRAGRSTSRESGVSFFQNNNSRAPSIAEEEVRGRRSGGSESHRAVSQETALNYPRDQDEQSSVHLSQHGGSVMETSSHRSHNTSRSVVMENEKLNYSRNTPMLFRRPSYQVFHHNNPNSRRNSPGTPNRYDAEVQQTINARMEFIKKLEKNHQNVIPTSNEDSQPIDQHANDRKSKRPEIVLEAPRQLGDSQTELNEVFQPMDMVNPKQGGAKDEHGRRYSDFPSVTSLPSKDAVLGSTATITTEAEKLLLDPLYPVISEENYRRLLVYNFEYTRRQEMKNALQNDTEPPLLNEGEEDEVFSYLYSNRLSSPEMSPIRYSGPSTYTRGSPSPYAAAAIARPITLTTDKRRSSASRSKVSGKNSSAATSARRKSSGAGGTKKGKKSAKPGAAKGKVTDSGLVVPVLPEDPQDVSGGSHLSLSPPQLYQKDSSPTTSLSGSPVRSAHLAGEEQQAARKIIDAVMPKPREVSQTSVKKRQSVSPVQRHTSTSRANSLSSVHLALINKVQNDLDKVRNDESSPSSVVNEEPAPEEDQSDCPRIDVLPWLTKDSTVDEEAKKELEDYVRYVWKEKLKENPECIEQWAALERKVIPNDSEARQQELDRQRRLLLVQQTREFTGLAYNVDFTYLELTGENPPLVDPIAGEEEVDDGEMEDEDFYFDGGHFENVLYILKLFGNVWSAESPAFLHDQAKNGGKKRPPKKGTKKKAGGTSPLPNVTQRRKSSGSEELEDFLSRQDAVPIELLFEREPPAEFLQTNES
ncbi:hypothetical protein ADEAN_000206800 [Angomonas deanei]|uniref:Uncharacterized protein n=1 Tax=Angomonas deanei TaxID=59799 RepID=A0A7G2C737_9TRYP|nr:hypothetical protein ADEAN_000206800 [Angomonas deanei]